MAEYTPGNDDVRIEYTSKRDNRHQSISHIWGRVDGRLRRWTQAQAIAVLKQQNAPYGFYTKDANGRVARVGVNGGFIQTHADGVWDNNLLALPVLPVWAPLPARSA